jgi:hypothetical protein
MRGEAQENRNRGQRTPDGNSGRRRHDANVISERLQFLAGLEAHSFAWRDADFLAGTRIAADAGLARAHVEYTEAAQLNSFPFAERILHRSKNGFDGLFSLGPAYPSLVYNRIYDIQLNHSTLLLFDGKLC